MMRGYAACSFREIVGMCKEVGGEGEANLNQGRTFSCAWILYYTILYYTMGIPGTHTPNS
jgi:hypothetical protein